MKRREFIAGLSAATVAVGMPFGARAQQAMPVIGFLNSASPVPFAHLVAGFRRGLSEAGFVEGQNIAIEYRWAEGHYDRLPALVAELIGRHVTVVVATGGEPVALAAKAASETIPIVFAGGGDPVKAGLVASLNRPGGNVTGFNQFTYELESKRIGLLHELVPTAKRIAMLVNGNNPASAAAIKEVEGAAARVARAFLVPPATIAQRIVRAKRTLAELGLTYETPRGDQLSERLSSVLEVVYLIFNEGYTAAIGDDWLRPQLCNEALRMGRVLTAIAPHEPEVHGLVALMELNASRTAARTDAAGEPILLLEQDRARWDQLQILRGMRTLIRARELGGARGFYVLQAAIIACHAEAKTAAVTDWPRIAGLYAELAAIAPSPVIELNRAVAIGLAEGPEAGLSIVDRLVGEPALEGYHLLPSVRGDLLYKLGRYDEARAAFEAAAALAGNRREHDLMRRRAAEAADAATAS